MFKCVAVFAISLAAAGCATTSDTAVAAKQVCTSEQVEATGSRVQTEEVCRPAE